MLPHHWLGHLQRVPRRVDVRLTTGQRPESQQAGRRHRIAARHACILPILGARDQRFVVVGREVETGAFRVGKMAQHDLGQFHGPVNPGLIKIGFVDRNECVDQVGVVVQVGVQFGFTEPPTVQQTTIGPTKFVEQESRGPLRRPQITRLVKHVGGLRHGVDHQRIPTDQDLVVLGRADAAIAHFEQPPPRLGQLAIQAFRIPTMDGRALGNRLGQIQDTLSLEVASRTDVVHITKPLGQFLAQDRAYFVGRPNVEFPFLPFAVGVLGTVETALGVRHVLKNVVERLGDHAGISRMARGAVGVQVDGGEQSVVVQHFFEVRRQPPRIDTVPREAAGQMIVDAALQHLV